MRPIRVECRLAGSVGGGEFPALDGLLEALSARRLGLPALCRSLPCPAAGGVPVPLAVGDAGGVPAFRCSAPIAPEPGGDSPRFLSRQFPAGVADGFPAAARFRTLNLTNGAYKSWRVPVRERAVGRLVWFAVGDPAGISDLLAGCWAVGACRGKGPGRVAEWGVSEWPEDWSWFAPSPAGPVLMRPLPAGDWLPPGLVGARPDFGAVQPPYWHPDRYRERVVPC